MDTLEELRKQRVELDMKIELLEYAEGTFQEGEVFWFVDAYGNIQQARWNESVWIKHCFYQGHIFNTEQEARLEAQRRNLLQRFKMFRDKCNDGWEPVSGKRCKNSKFFIGYGWNSIDEQYKLKSLELGSSNLFHQFGYFKNREDCDKAIELFGDEIKNLFVECE